MESKTYKCKGCDRIAVDWKNNSEYTCPKCEKKNNEKEYQTVEAMEKFGGSFVKALARAFHRADPINFIKLKNAFPEYWEEYKGFIKY